MSKKASPELLRKVNSALDKTVKFIFLSQGQIIEFSYINKNDGKDIICVPTQTACNLRCKFCFLSDYDLEVRNLAPEEIAAGVSYVINDLDLCGSRNDRNQVLLISYMGCGEPLLNIKNVIKTCECITKRHSKHYRVVRYGLASLIPALSLIKELTDEVVLRGILLKFHLSLHSTFSQKRKELLPAASGITESINAVSEYMKRTGNSAEIHYALISGENDKDEDIRGLVALLKDRAIPVKFLVYNEKPTIDFSASERVSIFREALEKEGIKTEFYIPPGGDIGSSCGQFLMDYYEKYNKKKKR